MLSHTHMEVLLKQKGEGSKLPRFDCFGLHFNERDWIKWEILPGTVTHNEDCTWRNMRT